MRARMALMTCSKLLLLLPCSRDADSVGQSLIFLFLFFSYCLSWEGRGLCYSCIVLVHRCILQYLSLLPIMLLLPPISFNLLVYALPARPTWMISPLCFSSPRKTGQEAPSALTSLSSSLVPMILNSLFSLSMAPNSGTTCWNLLRSLVLKSRSTDFS
jgi:hypothetical protein